MTTSPLLLLPPELRNRISRLTFCSPLAVTFTPSGRISDHPLTVTCRLLREESLRMWRYESQADPDCVTLTIRDFNLWTADSMIEKQGKRRSPLLYGGPLPHEASGTNIRPVGWQKLKIELQIYGPISEHAGALMVWALSTSAYIPACMSMPGILPKFSVKVNWAAARSRDMLRVFARIDKDIGFKAIHTRLAGRPRALWGIVDAWLSVIHAHQDDRLKAACDAHLVRSRSLRLEQPPEVPGVPNGPVSNAAMIG